MDNWYHINPHLGRSRRPDIVSPRRQLTEAGPASMMRHARSLKHGGNLFSDLPVLACAWSFYPKYNK